MVLRIVVVAVYYAASSTIGLVFLGRLGYKPSSQNLTSVIFCLLWSLSDLEPCTLGALYYYRHRLRSIKRLRFLVHWGEAPVLDLAGCRFIPVGLLSATPAVVKRAVALVRAVVVAMVVGVVIVGLVEDAADYIFFLLAFD